MEVKAASSWRQGSCNYGFRQVSLPGCVFGKKAQAALANKREAGNRRHCLELRMVNCVGGWVEKERITTRSDLAGSCHSGPLPTSVQKLDVVCLGVG